MWLAVLLRGGNGNVKKEIPFSWVHSVDVVQIFNRGISHVKNHLIYYSEDITEDPNFKLPVQDFFEENVERGCYHAKIRYCAGTYFFSLYTQNGFVTSFGGRSDVRQN